MRRTRRSGGGGGVEDGGHSFAEPSGDVDGDGVAGLHLLLAVVAEDAVLVREALGVGGFAGGEHPEVAVLDRDWLEAVEQPEKRFAIGVQWHPECLPEEPAMQRLFSEFVNAARE